MGERMSENKDNVLEEHVYLVGRTDCPVGARYILVLPERLTLSEKEKWPRQVSNLDCVCVALT